MRRRKHAMDRSHRTPCRDVRAAHRTPEASPRGATTCNDWRRPPRQHHRGGAHRRCLGLRLALTGALASNVFAATIEEAGSDQGMIPNLETPWCSIPVQRDARPPFICSGRQRAAPCKKELQVMSLLFARPQTVRLHRSLALGPALGSLAAWRVRAIVRPATMINRPSLDGANAIVSAAVVHAKEMGCWKSSRFDSTGFLRRSPPWMARA